MTTRTDAPDTTSMAWGSDAVAAVVRALGLKYAALVPGASYRGLHDSIVNYLGNENPQMLLCLHEEHTVAIAQGFAKVTEEPMLAIVHSNVGLMHATMAFFNAWCDRSPVVVLGATGPVDAMKRRPWIDWIHTTQDMGALVRNYTKWDDTPHSPGAAVESVLRAPGKSRRTRTVRADVRHALDAELQEEQARLRAAPAHSRRGREIRARPGVFRRPRRPTSSACWPRSARRNIGRVILAGRSSPHDRFVGRARRAGRSSERARG